MEKTIPIVVRFSRAGNPRVGVKLTTQREYRVTVNNEAWEISLTPTSYPLSEAIRQITLKGREHVDQISVTSTASDQMTIRFSELRTRPEQLTEHEIELYDW